MMDWEIVFEHLVEALTPEGQWSLSERTSDVEIKFQRAMPDGWSYSTVRAKMNALGDNRLVDHPVEWATLASYYQPIEVGTAHDMQMARLFVHEVLAGSKGLPSVEEIIAEKFVFDREGTANWSAQPYRIYECRMPKGDLGITLTDFSTRVVYCPARSSYFHTLLSVATGRFTTKQARYPVFWPDGVDVHRLAAKFTVDVIEPWVRDNRMDLLDRGGRKRK